jgi:hypothetical protein
MHASNEDRAASTGDGASAPAARSGAAVIAYDAFISYRHTPRQSAIARTLQRALHGFAKPWYRLRAVRLYRDETNLGARPDLWVAIQAALDRSRYLLLMASPDAAASPWVDKEVTHWLDTKGEKTLLIVVTDGTVAWDEPLGRFDPARTTALPPAALARLTTEPFWVDLSWAGQAERDLRIDHTRFRDAVASVAATLRGADKDEISGEDIRQRRRTMRLAWSAAGGLALLAATSLVGGVLAIQQGEQARREQARATTWAERRLFTISLILAQQVEGDRAFTSVDYNDFEGLTFGMYLGWNQSVGRLGALLTAMRTADQTRFDEIFADGDAAGATALLAFVNGPKGGFARNQSDARFGFATPEWQERFRRAGADPTFQQVQLDLALADFRRNRQIITTEMPALTTERATAFMLDVMTQHGPAAARRFYRAVPPGTMGERAVLESVSQQSFDQTRTRQPTIARNIQRRRALFRTTPLLLDDSLSAADSQPPWYEDVFAWVARLWRR